MTNVKLWFGAIVVIILLVLYVYTLAWAIDLAITGTKPVEKLPDGVSRTMATVGGLVSALVIAQLAVTDPEKPFKWPIIPSRGFWGTISDWIVPVTKVFYVLVWTVLGFAAFVVGELWHPDKVAPLTTFAQAWLGLAVAAGYAFFGLDPPAN
jgi:hypothetical protein